VNPITLVCAPLFHAFVEIRDTCEIFLESDSPSPLEKVARMPMKSNIIFTDSTQLGSEIDRKKIVFDQSIFPFSSISIGFDSILPGNFVSKEEANFKYTLYGLF